MTPLATFALGMQAQGCAVSKAMLDDIAGQEAACKATLQRAQDKLQRLNSDAELAKHQTTLDDLQRRASSLRQVNPLYKDTLFYNNAW